MALNNFKHLLIKGEERLSRGEYFSLLSILWVVNMLPQSRMVYSLLNQILMTHGIASPTVLGAQTQFNQIFNLITPSFVPWSLVLLALTTLTIRRVYRFKSKIITLVCGALTYLFYRGLIAIPILIVSVLPGAMEQYYYKEFMETPMITTLLLMIPFSMAGMILSIRPLFTLKKTEDIPYGREMTPRRFTHIYLMVSFTLYCLTTISLCLASQLFWDKMYLLESFVEEPLSILTMGVLGLTLAIFFIWLIVTRLIDSGKSLLYLLIYPLALTLMILPIFNMEKQDLLINGLTLNAAFVGVELPSLLFLWLCFLPSRKELRM